MPTAIFSTSSSYTFLANSFQSLSFNPIGETSGAVVTAVSYVFRVVGQGSSPLDLGKVDVFLEAPDGKRESIFGLFDLFGVQNDKGNGMDGSFPAASNAP